MATQTEPIVVPEDIRRRARQLHKQLRHKPGLEELVHPDDWKDASPMYFGMLSGVFALRKARERLGLSIADLAAQIEAEPEALEQLERGETVNPPWKLLATYAVAVNCRLSLNVEPV
jgi:DNA-binding XRE family transcriptional regulator